MSFYLLLSRFRDGEFVPMDFELFRKIMWRDATIEKDDPDEWINYAGGAVKVSYSYSDIDGAFSGALFDYFHGPIFYQRVVELLQASGGAVYWGSDTPSLAVGDPEVIPHLSEHIVETFGPAHVVRTGRELSDMISDGTLPGNPCAAEQPAEELEKEPRNATNVIRFRRFRCVSK